MVSTCKETAKSRVVECLKGTMIEGFENGDALMRLTVVENEQFWIGMLLSLGDQVEVLSNETYLLRFVEALDAHDLLSVYSDEKAVPYFNSDNCDGDFHCTLLEHVNGMIEAWQWECDRKQLESGCIKVGKYSKLL